MSKLQADAFILLMRDSDFIMGGHRQMTQSDVQGGCARYGGVIFPCTVGTFTLENPLVAAGGGRTPRLMGLIEIATEDFPPGMNPQWASDQAIEVTDGAGFVRECKLAGWISMGPIWQLSVVDINEGA